MKIDTRGNTHQPGGSPAGGQFTEKTNSRPPAELTPVSARPSLPPRRGATMARGDFDGFGMTALHTMPGSESEAFTATLTHDGKQVGTVHQEGRGGATWCQFRTWEARDRFNQMVFDNWDFDRVFASPDGETTALPHDDESVLDTLFFDATLRKQLDRDRARGHLPVLDAEDLKRIEENDAVTSFNILPGRATDVAAAAADMKARGELSGALYWDGEAWVAFEA